MNSFCKSLRVLGISFIFASTSASAQFKSSGIEVGVNVGTFIYQGDLSKSFVGEYKGLTPAIGISVSKLLDPYFALRGNLTFGKIASDELKYKTPEFKQLRAFNFSTPVTELALNLVFTPTGVFSDRKLTPYLFVGAGAAFLNVRRDWHNYNSTYYNSKSQVQKGLAIDTLRTPPSVVAVLPAGAGLRYAVGEQLFLNAEAGYRFTASDYIDGFKYSGNSAKRDGYYNISLGISYRFGGYKCPPVR